ncbi:lysozyme inhibitor LprI family protein [uncultured Sphingomonas sp.]|uniref:lysozyme inhibitor LprI family protein n=1 Tax=uncultured Sphingomonas sp. TaxID=158754 RepID=UPI0035C968B4
MKTITIMVSASLLAAGAAPQTERPVRVDGKGELIAATAPSFDCASARGFAETMICADAVLGSTDRTIAELYAGLLHHTRAAARAAVHAEQVDWLRSRDTCAERVCLSASLEEREKQLQAQVDATDAALRAGLSRVGRCETTKLDHISERLEPVEGEKPDGMSLGYADGVRQVSYDRDPAVLRSRLGDPVRVCLASIPSHCPPNDERGRVYRIRNLRTGVTWRLPDAEHECGGA